MLIRSLLIIGLSAFSNLALAQFTITNASWTSTDDNDSDGYSRSRTLNITIANTGANSSAIIEMRAWENGQSEALYGNSSSFAVSNGTFIYTINIGSTSTIGGELSNNTYDFRVLLRASVGGTQLATRSDADDSDLRDELFETSSQDTQASMTNASWSSTVDADVDTYSRTRTLNITINNPGNNRTSRYRVGRG